MATCNDCLHYKICPYDSKTHERENCKYFKDKTNFVELRHGEWQQNPYCKRIYFCSECGRHIEDGSNNPLEHFPYCHCGAKMGGGNKNAN